MQCIKYKLPAGNRNSVASMILFYSWCLFNLNLYIVPVNQTSKPIAMQLAKLTKGKLKLKILHASTLESPSDKEFEFVIFR